MKPVMQTVTGPRGNCYAACLASLLEIPIEEVPDFHAGTEDDTDDNVISAKWWNNLNGWLGSMNFGVVILTFTDAAQWQRLCLQGYHIVSGKSPRDLHHATVWHGGKMVHDPHPEQSGLVELQVIDMLYPLDPSKILK